MSRAATGRLAVFAVASVALAVGVARADAVKSRFHFKVPSGWVDKSQPDMRDYLTLAMDEAHQLVFQASVRPKAETVTTQFLADYVQETANSLARRLGRGQLKVVSKSMVDVGGVHAARFVFELSKLSDDHPEAVRELQYYVPAGDQAAVLTFTAPGETYGKYEALFDKTARSTLIRK